MEMFDRELNEEIIQFVETKYKYLTSAQREVSKLLDESVRNEELLYLIAKIEHVLRHAQTDLGLIGVDLYNLLDKE